MNRLVFLFTAAAAIAAACTARAADAGPLRLAHTIPLPGVKGRFDHFACDASAKRLVVAALGNNTGEVFDVGEFKRLHTVTGLHKPTGALVIVEPRRLYFANGDDGTFRSFDGASFTPGSQLAGMDDADNVRFDALAKLIYVGYGEGALGVTNPAPGKLLHSIALAAHPESFQLEAHGPRIFVNIPDRKQIAVVDREQRKVVATWPMEKWQANFPMALDETAQRLIIGCRSPARLVVLDTTRGVPVADLEISGDTDDLFFDQKRQRLYVSCGEGFLDVIQRREGDRYERTHRIATRSGARTCFFSPELDLLFLAVPERDGREAELRVYQPE
jgi:hypothetical protein